MPNNPIPERTWKRAGFHIGQPVCWYSQGDQHGVVAELPDHWGHVVVLGEDGHEHKVHMDRLKSR